MVPELDGFSAVKEIRKKQDIPVLMLSARGEEYDKIHGFELGSVLNTEILDEKTYLV